MTSSSEVLRAGFGHHVWATITLIDALDGLPSERLDAQIPGTYGSIIRTLAHLVAADDRYLRRLAGEQLPPSTDADEPPLDELRASMRAQADRWTAVLDLLDAGSLDVAFPGRADYPETPHAEGLFLLQALHHGDDHRTQVCSTLGALSLDVPELDGWTYWVDGRDRDGRG